MEEIITEKNFTSHIVPFFSLFKSTNRSISYFEPSVRVRTETNTRLRFHLNINTVSV